MELEGLLVNVLINATNLIKGLHLGHMCQSLITMIA